MRANKFRRVVSVSQRLVRHPDPVLKMNTHAFYMKNIKIKIQYIKYDDMAHSDRVKKPRHFDILLGVR